MTEQPDDRFLHAVRAEPRPEFAARLAAHLGSGVTTPHCSRLRFRSLRHGRTIVSLAAVAVLLLALGLSAFWLSRGSQQVSAQEVLRKVVTLNVDDLGIQTYHLRTESDISFPAQFNGGMPVPGSVLHSTSVFERWVSLPNRWRTDFRDASQPFIPGTDRVSGSVSDGTTEWSYNQDPAGSEYDVQIGALRPDVTPPALSTIPLPVGDLQPGQAVGVAGNNQRPGESPMRHAFLSCYQDARITGTATIAGRQAYMIDLGPDSCPPGYRLVAGGTPIPMATLSPARQGRHTLWVDKQLSVVLKLELFNGDGSLQGRSEVTAFAVNQFIPESVFTFAPPPEVTHPQVTDRRPQPYQLPGSAISCDGCTMPGLVYPSPTPRPPATPAAGAARGLTDSIELIPLANSGGRWLRLHERDEGGPTRLGERRVVEPLSDADEVDGRRRQDVLQMRLRRADVFRTAQAEGAHPLRDRPLDACASGILRCEGLRFLLGAPLL